MGFLYFDESIHEKGGFIIGAFVYSTVDLNGEIQEAIKKCGLVPDRDEYKSGMHVGRHPEQVALRDMLKQLVQKTRIAVVIVPSDRRHELGQAALLCLKQLMEYHQRAADLHSAYFDENIFPSIADAEKVASDLGLNEQFKFYFERDSRVVCGLQLADLVAHTCSIMLLESLGLVTKTVKAGENSGYEPDLDVEIGFELWAGLRYNFFSKPAPHPDTWRDQSDYKCEVKGVGLYISDSCSDLLREKALARFGEMYLGCIH